jgi:uncharacterized SAM-binding protein YcdF (DUF218 family)
LEPICICRRRTIWLRAATGAFVVALVVGFICFRSATNEMRSGPIDQDADAVVYTGDPERIDVGLELLRKGTVKHLFVSGANPSAGIWPSAFEAQFRSGHPGLHELMDCCVELGERAANTLQNALETQCWAGRRLINKPVVLVTSAAHMPRALSVLRAVAPDLQIIPFPVRTPELLAIDSLKRDLGEFVKTIAMQIVVHTPWSRKLWPSIYGYWEKGCP